MNSVEDGRVLQADMNTLCEWVRRWQMEFNKLFVVGSGNIKYQYAMQGRRLSTVETVRDLGVYISSNLKSAAHCYEATCSCKANKMLGLVKRLSSIGLQISWSDYTQVWFGPT